MFFFVCLALHCQALYFFFFRKKKYTSTRCALHWQSLIRTCPAHFVSQSCTQMQTHCTGGETTPPCVVCFPLNIRRKQQMPCPRASRLPIPTRTTPTNVNAPRSRRPPPQHPRPRPRLPPRRRPRRRPPPRLPPRTLTSTTGTSSIGGGALITSTTTTRSSISSNTMAMQPIHLLRLPSLPRCAHRRCMSSTHTSRIH